LNNNLREIVPLGGDLALDVPTIPWIGRLNRRRAGLIICLFEFSFSIVIHIIY
jgi:hypothetical protein